jgi:CBS domain containing-hemolysin-like protein
MVRTGHVPKTGDIIKVSENVVAEVLDANLRSIKRLKIIYNEEVED